MLNSLKNICLACALVSSSALVYIIDSPSELRSVVSSHGLCLELDQQFSYEYMERALKAMESTYLGPLYKDAKMQASSCEDQGYKRALNERDSCFKGLHRFAKDEMLADLRTSLGDNIEYIKGVVSKMPEKMMLWETNSAGDGPVDLAKHEIHKNMRAVCDNYDILLQVPCLEKDDKGKIIGQCPHNADKGLRMLEDNHKEQVRSKNGGKPQCGVIWMGGMLGTADPDLKLFDGVIPERFEDGGLDCEYIFPEAPLGSVAFSTNPDVKMEFKWIQYYCKDETTTRRWWDFDEFGMCPEEASHKVDSFASMRENVPQVHKAIRDLMAKDIPAEKIFLAGYSQGGAQAFQSAAEFPEKLGGIIMYLAPVVGKHDDKDPSHFHVPKEHLHSANKDQHVLYLHAPEDFFVKPCYSEASMEGAREFGWKVTPVVIPGMHQKKPPMFATDKMIEFIKSEAHIV